MSAAPRSDAYPAGSGRAAGIFQSLDPEGDEKALAAMEVYVHTIIRFIGSYIAVMGGVDAIIFTAGIGENAPSLRKEICKRLAYLGIGLNEEKNALKGETVEISTPDSKVKVFVIPTNEELMIAKDTVNLVK